MEEFSPLGSQAFLLVDLRGASAAQAESSHKLLKARLSQLPCPSIALAGQSRANESVAAADSAAVVVPATATGTDPGATAVHAATGDPGATVVCAATGDPGATAVRAVKRDPGDTVVRAVKGDPGATVVRAATGDGGLGSGSRAAVAVPAASPLCSDFDLVLSDARQLDVIVSRIEANPLAAAALAALLRHNEKSTVHEGLLAESLVYSTLQAGPEFARWLARKPAPRPAVSEFEPAVLISRQGKSLRLRLNRPHKHNAFCIEMRDRLCEGLNLAAADPGIKEICLDGAGPSFCSGGDLDEFGTFPDPATAHAVRCTRSPARSMAAVARRCKVRVHGACVGAGIELPAFAAKLTASPEAYFQLPEVSMGLVPGAGGTVSICKRIGRQQTAFMALSAETVDTKTALAWGLIDGIENE